MGQETVDALFTAVYEDLRPRARLLLRGERRNHTLSTMALVNDAYLRLRKSPAFRGTSVDQFLAYVVQAMRRILIDHARRRNTKKRGEGRSAAQLREEIDRAHIDPSIAIELTDLLDALKREGARPARQAQIFELHVLAGQAIETIAMSLGISRSTAYDDWLVVRARMIAEFSHE